MKTMTNLSLCLGLVLAGFTASAATHEIKMLNNGKDGIMVFEPGFLKVAKGDSVKFVPTDPAHEVASVTIPKDAKAWKSDGKKAITVKLDKEGVYLYDCNVHLPMAMAGIIQVGSSASNYAEAQASSKEVAKKFVVSKDRLDKYFAKVTK